MKKVRGFGGGGKTPVFREEIHGLPLWKGLIISLLS
jgi:hypothetical protein